MQSFSIKTDPYERMKITSVALMWQVIVMGRSVDLFCFDLFSD